ncbi:MAG TPA: hypothetical protein ENJ83_06220, partial [Rhodospirillales bacterium]|nr:hypothetical protein [Rhodospirillales bacterium]
MPADLDKIHREREQLLHLHEQVLARAVAVVRGQAPPTGEKALDLSHHLAQELEAARAQLERQEVRIAELRQQLVDLEELKVQYRVLEETNERLMRQLLRMDDDLAERAELQQIIDMQKDALEKGARRVHELEERNRVLQHNIEVLERENELARERVFRLQEQMHPLIDVQERNHHEINRLRAQL